MALPSLSGVFLGADDTGVAVGGFGEVLLRDAAGWHEQDKGFEFNQTLHATWVDPSGGIWAVGGNTLSVTLNEGVMIHWSAGE
jgi:hypothetical protein